MRRAMNFVVILLFVTQCSMLCAQPHQTAGGRGVRVGSEVFIEKYLSSVNGKNVGIICNHTSVLQNGVHLADTLVKLGVHVSALFSPEHGIRGVASAGSNVGDTIDQQTQIPIFSLYGKRHKPTAEMLKNVDVILFDLQDVGARYYTYSSTMALAMEAAAENGKKFIVLDRPNPINGIDVEGPVLDTMLQSFVGMFPIPVRHGLTLGELAKMIVGEHWFHEPSKLDLDVIPMEQWKRSMWYDETGLPWIAPSPNMKTLSTATVYPGTCLFEATNVSEGRGTEKPFEYIGAPWIDGKKIAQELNSQKCLGVTFKAVEFTPEAQNSKFNNEQCSGVMLLVLDRKIFLPVNTAITMLVVIRKFYPKQLQINESRYDRLAGTSALRLSLLGVNATAIFGDENDKLARFKKTRRNYLLYE